MKKIAFFVAIFIFTTALGLYIGHQLIGEFSKDPDLDYGEKSPVTGMNVDDPMNTVFFVAYIIVATFVLLIILKYYTGNLLYRIFEVLLIFFGSWVVYGIAFYDIINVLPVWVSATFYEFLVFFAAALTVIVRFIRRKFFVLNLTLALTVAGVGAMLGSSVGFIPALLLVIVLAVYDMVAVFGTKHMLKLAEGGKIRKLPVMFETDARDIKTMKAPKKGVKPSGVVKSDTLGLGTGDIALPLTFFVSIMRDYTLTNAIAAAVGGLVGLAAVIYYVTSVKRIALPALPPIIGGSILALGISLLL